MPTNAVYQPTTVSFETTGGLLAQTANSNSRLKIFRKPLMQILLLVASLLFLASGIILVVAGSADLSDVEQHRDENTEYLPKEEEIDIGVIFGGVILTIIGFALFGLYIKVAEWRRNCVCPCGLSKKQQQQQILAMNPSTDPLVTHTAQYAPVSEIPRVEDEERRNLMPDNKEW